MSTRQFNVELPEDEIRKIKKDALEMNVPLTSYALKVFRRFRQEKTIDQRRACFDKDDKKTVGRKAVTT
jgi:hypothetical protein